MKHFEEVGQGGLQDMLERRKGKEREEHSRTKGRMIEAVGNGGRDGLIGGDGIVVGVLGQGHGHEQGQEEARWRRPRCHRNRPLRPPRQCRHREMGPSLSQTPTARQKQGAPIRPQIP